MKKSTFKYLVIEDDKSIWKNISARMQKFLQWKAVPFTDSLEEAITLIDTHRPDLIFSDWSIRGGNAYPILTHIHQSSGYTPYIIFFTGYQGENPEIPQIVFNEFPLVKKYLVKPIFQQLTENLTQYIAEAEALAEGEQETPVFIENYLKQQVRIFPKQILCILQDEENPRLKVLHCLSGKTIQLKQTWEEIHRFCVEQQLSIFVANTRKAIVNREYILRMNRPFLWLEGGLRIQVSREQWPLLTSPCYLSCTNIYTSCTKTRFALDKYKKSTIFAMSNRKKE